MNKYQIFIILAVTFTLNQSLTGMFDGANIAVDSVIAPNYILISGNDATSTISTYLYTNSLGDISLSEFTFLGVRGGTLAFADFNNDGKQEIIISGNNIFKRYSK